MADDKKDTMTIKIKEADLLDLLGENGEHWVQGTWGNDQTMCLHGAIRRCSPVPGNAHLIEQVAKVKGWGTDWNDADDTTWEMVRARLDQVEVTDADLADTFGPQWEPIVALVRRAAIMTDDEADRLVAAVDAAFDAAWDAARAAAGDTAGDAARAAVAAAWAAMARRPWGAARVPIGSAMALAVRHLISEHGFTQAHYDTLTGPWRTVIGPIHPDDAEITAWQEARRG